MTTFEPLPPPTGGRGTPRARALAALAADLTAAPGQWARVGTYGTAESARTTASLIRRGRLAVFGPAGAFEAESRSVLGEHSVWARYVAEGVPAAAPAPLLSDGERSFLRHALGLAADAMANDSTDYSPDDEAALASLRKLAGEAQ